MSLLDDVNDMIFMLESTNATFHQPCNASLRKFLVTLYDTKIYLQIVCLFFDLKHTKKKLTFHFLAHVRLETYGHSHLWALFGSAIGSFSIIWNVWHLWGATITTVTKVNTHKLRANHARTERYTKENCFFLHISLKCSSFWSCVAFSLAQYCRLLCGRAHKIPSFLCAPSLQINHKTTEGLGLWYIPFHIASRGICIKISANPHYILNTQEFSVHKSWAVCSGFIKK